MKRSTMKIDSKYNNVGEETAETDYESMRTSIKKMCQAKIAEMVQKKRYVSRRFAPLDCFFYTRSIIRCYNMTWFLLVVFCFTFSSPFLLFYVLINFDLVITVITFTVFLMLLSFTVPFVCMYKTRPRQQVYKIAYYEEDPQKCLSSLLPSDERCDALFNEAKQICIQRVAAEVVEQAVCLKYREEVDDLAEPVRGEYLCDRDSDLYYRGGGRRSCREEDDSDSVVDLTDVGVQ